MTDSSAKDTAAGKRRYGGVSGEERLRQRRERFLEAALEVFGTLGYNRATMRDVCAHARLAERYFYENFSDLDDAFETVFHSLNQQLVAEIGEAMAAAPMETRAQGKAALHAFFRFIKDDPRRAQIMLRDVHQFEHQRGAATSVIHEYARIVRATAETLHPGLPPSINLDLIASGLVGMIVQTCITWVDADFRDSIETVVEHNVYAWRGLDRWFLRLRKETSSQPAPPPPPLKRDGHGATG